MPGPYAGNPAIGIPGPYPNVPGIPMPGPYAGNPAIGIPSPYPNVPGVGMPGPCAGNPAVGIPGPYPQVGLYSGYSGLDYSYMMDAPAMVGCGSLPGMPMTGLGGIFLFNYGYSSFGA